MTGVTIIVQLAERSDILNQNTVMLLVGHMKIGNNLKASNFYIKGYLLFS